MLSETCVLYNYRKMCNTYLHTNQWHKNTLVNIHCWDYSYMVPHFKKKSSTNHQPSQSTLPSLIMCLVPTLTHPSPHMILAIMVLFMFLCMCMRGSGWGGNARQLQLCIFFPGFVLYCSLWRTLCFQRVGILESLIITITIFMHKVW